MLTSQERNLRLCMQNGCVAVTVQHDNRMSGSLSSRSVATVTNGLATNHTALLQCRPTNSLSLRRRAQFERPSVVQPLGSFPALYRTRMFIAAFTRALHLSLSWARPIQSTTPNPISKSSILMLPTTYNLVFLVVSFPLAFPTNNLYTVLFSPIHAACSAHLSLLDFIILNIVDEATPTLLTRFL
jgi:hypothetical protein